MTIEDIENTWDAQFRPTAAAAPATVRGHVQRALQHKRRMLVFYSAIALLGMIVNQALFVANTINVDQPVTPSRLIQLGLLQALNIVCLLLYLRRIKSIRRLRRQAGETVRAALGAALQHLRVEMSDYRLGAAAFPVAFALALWSINFNHPIAQFGWDPFLQRAAILLAIVLPVALAAGRHYFANLVPEFRRTQKNLEELQ